MPVNVSWDDEARTLLSFRIAGHWTSQELNWSWLECIAMIKSVPHNVNTIVDITEMVNMPMDLVMQTVQLIRSQPHNAGVSFVTTDSRYLNLLFDNLRRITPRESVFLRDVPKVEAARQTLATMAN